MKAIEARIRNFRSIDDSGWVPLDRVTAFVGRNESGKTSLLKALHKFNPSTKEPYDPQREFPRDRLKRDYRADKEFPVSTVRFEFSPEERDSVAEIVGGDAPTHVVCTRYYSGKLTVEVEPSIVDAPLRDGRGPPQAAEVAPRRGDDRSLLPAHIVVGLPACREGKVG